MQHDHPSATIGIHHVRGLPLVWHGWGPVEDVPVLVAIHGFLDHGEAFAPMAAALARSVRVVAPDLRGHGRSGWVGDGGYYHFPDYWHDVCAVLDHLQLERCHLLGHSMGGMVATGVAALLGDRIQSVILLDGMGPHAHAPEHVLERARRWHAALSVPGFTGDVEARRRARRPMPDVGAAAQRLQLANPRLSTERALALAGTGTEPAAGGHGVVWRHDPLHRTPSVRPFRVDEAAPLWRAITAPVLSIYADGSEWLPEDLAERHAVVPRLVTGTLAQAGHNAHHEQPEPLARIVLDWLQNPGGALPSGLVPGAPVR